MPSLTCCSGCSITDALANLFRRRQAEPKKNAFRTATSEVVPPAEALEELKAGNRRFLAGTPQGPRACANLASACEALATQGQSPLAVVIGCADSRCPVEILFDAMPGDLFVLRNAGNTCTHAEGSMVGSTEFAVGALRSRLVLVLGHTNCGAIKGAAASFLEWKRRMAQGKIDRTVSELKRQTALEALLEDLRDLVQDAESDLPPGASSQEIVNSAVVLNVFRTMDFLLRHSRPLREKVRAGEVEIHGAVYQLDSGEVKFLGQSPQQKEMLESEGKNVQIIRLRSVSAIVPR